jgi:AraC-like DNA-binding protein
MAISALQLYDPRNGDLAFKVESFARDADRPFERRFNYFSIYWIQQGRGDFWADQASASFEANSLLFFVPYQRFRLVPTEATTGVAIQFHANFLCIETHHAEVGCHGVLFNDVYGQPAVRLDGRREPEFRDLIERMRRELTDGAVAHSEALLSYLKIFLVQATRLKHEQQTLAPAAAAAKKPAFVEELKQLLEANYRREHSPSFYARQLHLAPKSLAKLVKAHLHKTLTELIRERVLNQAKWDLLHTLKPVKQIAAEVGFDDELYFSRMFKRAAGCSPTFFREFETTIRGGSNVWNP